MCSLPGKETTLPSFPWSWVELINLCNRFKWMWDVQPLGNVFRRTGDRLLFFSSCCWLECRHDGWNWCSPLGPWGRNHRQRMWICGSLTSWNRPTSLDYFTSWDLKWERNTFLSILQTTFALSYPNQYLYIILSPSLCFPAPLSLWDPTANSISLVTSSSSHSSLKLFW